MHHPEFGFVTVAMGPLKYLEMAVDMALSVRVFHDDPVCLLCDAPTMAIALEKYSEVFDPIVLIDTPLKHPLASNFLLAELAPFERGFYIDADVLAVAPLDIWIEETRNRPIWMMGYYVTLGSGKTHHDISIDRLIKAFGVDSFFTNHSGALGYQREPARAFFKKSHDIFNQLYKRKWRAQGMVGNEQAFGLAAAGLNFPKMDPHGPIFWPEELINLRLTDTIGKALVHFIAPMPLETMDSLMAGVSERRRANNLTGSVEAQWRAKSAGVIRYKRLFRYRNAAVKKIQSFGHFRRPQLVEKLATAVSAPPAPKVQIASNEPTHKLYYHHLMKCGGTSFNPWISTHFPDYGTRQREAQIFGYSQHADQEMYPLRDRMKLRSFAAEAFSKLDCVVDHAPLAHFAPPDTLRVTCLRDSKERLISHCRDWRRYTPEQIAREGPNMRDGLTKLFEAPFKDFLEGVGRKEGPPGQFLNNYMTRALAENRVGMLATMQMDLSLLYPVALEVLHEDFDVVGVLEDQIGFRQSIAHRMRWSPPAEMPHLNQTASDLVNHFEIEQATDIIAELTHFDDLIYAEAKKLAGQHKQNASVWTAQKFEEEAAADQLSKLTHGSHEGFHTFDASGPIFAGGHANRVAQEGALGLNLTTENDFFLYIPIPANTDGDLAIWFEGLGAHDVLESTTITFDGQEVTPEMTKNGIGPFRVTFPWRSTRPFVRLDMHFSDRQHHIALSLRRYGWKSR